jgi:hypothetical protein
MNCCIDHSQKRLAGAVAELELVDRERTLDSRPASAAHNRWSDLLYRAPGLRAAATTLDFNALNQDPALERPPAVR